MEETNDHGENSDVPSDGSEGASACEDTSECSSDKSGLVVGMKFTSFDEVIKVLDDLKAAHHHLRVFNSQSVDEYNKRRAKAKTPLEPVS